MITSNGFRSNHEHLFYGILNVLEQELSDKHDDIELMEAANGIIDAYSGKVSKAIIADRHANPTHYSRDTYNVLANYPWILSNEYSHDDSAEGFSTISIKERISDLLSL